MAEKTEIRIPLLVYSRIVGYLTPVANWHAGKQQEFRDRLPFAVPAVVWELDGKKETDAVG